MKNDVKLIVSLDLFILDSNILVKSIHVSTLFKCLAPNQISFLG